MVYNHFRTQNVVLTLSYWELKRRTLTSVPFFTVFMTYLILLGIETIENHRHSGDMPFLPYPIGNWNNSNLSKLMNQSPLTLSYWELKLSSLWRPPLKKIFAYLILLGIETIIDASTKTPSPTYLTLSGIETSIDFHRLSYLSARLTLPYRELKPFSAFFHSESGSAYLTLSGIETSKGRVYKVFSRSYLTLSGIETRW